MESAGILLFYVESGLWEARRCWGRCLSRVEEEDAKIRGRCLTSHQQHGACSESGEHGTGGIGSGFDILTLWTSAALLAAHDAPITNVCPALDRL